MAEKDWRETMGAPFAEAEEPQYDVGAIRRATTDTPAHAEMFNGVFQQLIDNTAAVKRMAEGTQETLEREISNPNLLENWDFRNPVNRNGKGEYTESGITIDKWELARRNYESSVLVNEGDVTFRITNSSSLGNPPFFGTYKTREVGKATYTISLLVKEVNGLFSLGVQWDGAPWTTFASIEGLRIGLNTCTFSIPENNVPPLIFVMGENVGSITMEAIKLELGDHQTLARQNDLGEWEIIDPPNYDLQYALCSQYNPANGEWQGGVSLDANGRVPVAQLPCNDLTVYVSPDGVDALDRGSQDAPLRTPWYALINFGYPGRWLQINVALGSYGAFSVPSGYNVVLQATEPTQKPTFSGISVAVNAALKMYDCKIERGGGGGVAACLNRGTIIFDSINFKCINPTGNVSAISLAGGAVYVSNCTFENFSQCIFLSYLAARSNGFWTPALLVSRNNSGANPNAHQGVFRADSGVIMWRQGTQPTGAGGTTVVTTVNGGQVYGS